MFSKKYILYILYMYIYMGFPSGSAVKSLPANAGDVRDMSLVPGLRRSAGEGNGNPPQHS